MHSFIKSTIKIAVVAGFLAASVNTAEAQQAFGGSVQMGSNGPVATFGGPSLLGGNRYVGPTQNAGFGFSPVDTGSRAAGAPLGPQGQRGQGYGFGVGSGGNAYNSQGATGVQSRESVRTQGNTYGQAQNTANQQRWIRPGREFQETNILSQNSVFNQPIPSNSFNLGFRGGAQGWGGTIRGLRRGWILPPTATTSVDLNIVDP